MLRKTQHLAIAFIGLGAAIGYATATGKLASLFAQEKKAVEVAEAQPKAEPYKLDRTSLPIAEPKLAPITTLDARNAKAPPRFEVKAPAGAPNVLIILIDDMGFGQSSAFGGPIHMPTCEKLASNGL